jgi:hypothetical protein
MMKKIHLAVILIFLVAGFSAIGQVRYGLRLDLHFDQPVISRAPAFVKIPGGDYKIMVEGIHLRPSGVSVGLSVAGDLEVNINDNTRFATGIGAGVRTLRLRYENENLFFYSTAGKENFTAEITRQLRLLSVPAMVKTRLFKNIFAETGVVGNLVLSTKKSTTTDQPQLRYQLDILSAPATNNAFLDLNLGLSLHRERFCVKVAYNRSLTRIVEKVDNGYNLLIPHNIYLSGFALSVTLNSRTLSSQEK